MPQSNVEKVVIEDSEYYFKTTGDDYLGLDEQGTIEAGDTGWISGGDVFDFIGEEPSSN